MVADYFASRGNIREIDFGRFLDTGAQQDLFVFRVPSLCNVAITAPYFHDGSVAQLDDAVRKMGEIQLGESLTEEEAGLIVRSEEHTSELQSLMRISYAAFCLTKKT